MIEWQDYKQWIVPQEYCQFTRWTNCKIIKFIISHKNVDKTVTTRMIQWQEYKPWIMPQECWQDCNHKNDTMTRILMITYATRLSNRKIWLHSCQHSCDIQSCQHSCEMIYVI